MSDGRKAWAEAEEAARMAAGGKSDFELRQERRQWAIDNRKMQLKARVNELIQEGRQSVTLSSRCSLSTL